MVVPLAEILWRTGRTGRARTRVSVGIGDRQALATEMLLEAANRQPLATAVPAEETLVTVALGLATRVRIAAEVETVSATAAFPVAVVPAAPAHSAAAPEAVRGAAVHAAHPAWAVPGAVVPGAVAGGGGK
jgi:hypothetical protein